MIARDRVIRKIKTEFYRGFVRMSADKAKLQRNIKDPN
jgi:hypothetical protein